MISFNIIIKNCIQNFDKIFYQYMVEMTIKFHKNNKMREILSKIIEEKFVAMFLMRKLYIFYNELMQKKREK